VVNALGGRPYGHLELPYKEFFAQALVESSGFRKWVLRRTIFAEFADEGRLLYREMLEKRSRSARLKANWAFSHYQERTRCACAGCCGQETDLLAVFENPASARFALHVEVKRPGDGFTGKREKQAAAYPVRAQC
jgi:hypothetical protein